MESINEFTYKVLLAELESIKGGKASITKFITKVYDLSNHLPSSPDKAESTRLAFMLITRAASYSAAARKHTKQFAQTLKDRARFIANSSVVTPDNVLETFEFWNEPLLFDPRMLSALIPLDGIISALKQASKPYDVYVYNIRDRIPYSTSYLSTVRAYILGTLGPNSTLLQNLSIPATKYKQVIEEAESAIQNLHIILKEINEQYRNSLTAV